MNNINHQVSQLSVNPINLNLYNIRNAIEMTALKYLNINDPIINYIVTIIVLSLIGTLMVKIEKIPEILLNIINKIYNSIKNILLNLYLKIKKAKLKKSIIIEKITDDIQINPLYHSLS